VRNGIDEQRKQVRLSRGERQEEVRARGRLYGAIDVAPCDAMLDRSHGLHATGRKAPTTANRREAEAAFVLAEAPDRASVRRWAQRLELGLTGGLERRNGLRGFGV
jgi:hypothetical protein